MTWNDVFILHLSDLHIEAKKNSSYSNSLRSLIADLREQTKTMEEIILVISGDIINKGEYTPQNIEAVSAFFTDLKDALAERVKDIQIVPGNHDKKRSRINSLICKDYMINEMTSSEHWQEIIEPYSSFFEITDMIYSIFGIGDGKRERETYGVHVTELNDAKICFVRVDTAWCSCADSSKDESDYSKLRIGKYQLSELTKKYQTTKRKCEDNKHPIDLTIAVSHHPINWLQPYDENECNRAFLSEDELNVDIILCGHVHNFSLAHSFNHQHSLLTLVTGFAGDIPSIKDNHRYSIYCMNVSNNSCDIIMRRTGENNQFRSDYSLYTGSEEERQKLTYPIKVRETHPYIQIASSTPKNEASLFIDNSTLSEISNVSHALTEISRSLALKSFPYKDNCIEMIAFTIEDIRCNESKSDSSTIDDMYSNQEILLAIYDHLYYGVEILNYHRKYLNYPGKEKDLSGYLKDICTDVVLFLADCFPQHTDIRAHFRFYNASDDQYRVVCYHTLKSSENSPPPKPVNWGGLIELAYSKKMPIVYSSNTRLNATSTDWNDFITIVPQIIDNEITVTVGTKTNKRKIYEKRPLLTFGVSVKSNQFSRKHSHVLDMLSFLRIDELIANAMNDFIEAFEIKPIMFFTSNT